MTQEIQMHPRGDLVRAFADAPQGGEIIRRLKERLEKEARMKLRIRRIAPRNGIPLPTPAYQSEGASGIDLYAAIPEVIWPGRRAVIPVEIAVEIPEGFEGQIRPRSGLASKGIDVILGTIDSDYRGELAATVANNSERAHTIRRGDRIAQLVIAPVVRVELEEADELSETARGERGFGSTGLTGSTPVGLGVSPETRKEMAEGEDSWPQKIAAPGATSEAEGVA